MHFSLFISSVSSAGLTGAGFLIAIAVLACVLGAEVAGICILVSKMLRARAAKLKDDQIRETGDHSSIYRDYAVTAVLLFGALPQASYIALTVLAVLTMLAAVVFVVLLVAFRACGYDFVSAAHLRQGMTQDEAQVEAQELDADASAVSEERLPDESEEQRQYAYTAEDAQGEEEEPFAMFAEESEQVYDGSECFADTESEEAAAEDEASSEALVAESVELLPASPASETTTVTTVREEGPAFADGSQPYKVVEKTVTETVKEVYTETPAPTQPPSSTNDAVLEKLVDLLEYEIRGRREQEGKEKEDKEENKRTDSVATFASSEAPVDEEDDEDDDDDLDTEEGDRTGDDEDDVDDEENDNDGDRFTGNERIIGFDEATGCYIVARYRKSFEAKLIQARPNIKQYYSDLKNALLSYKDTKSRVSWTADSFHNGRDQIAKINVKTKILELYLAIDPATLEGTVYRGRDVSHRKKYAETPFQYKIRTPRKFKWAMELVQRVSEEHGLAPIDIEHINYEEQYPFDTTENLVERKLIKEYIRQEKPATTFELDPDHIPLVPTEDESVIPANANFSWEFDNERMTEPEPAVEEEPVAEPEPEPVSEEPAPEPAPEPTAAPAPQATIKRETVKVTEVRYTERYYKDAQPTYEQVITTTEPIEAIAEPAIEIPESETGAELDATPVAEDAEASAEEEAWSQPEVLDDFDGESQETDAEELDEERFFADTAEESADESEESDEDALTREDDASDVEPTVEEAEEEFEETAEEEAASDYDAESEEAPVFEEAPVYDEESESEAEAFDESDAQEDKPSANLNPSVAVVDICSIESAFPAGAVINLDVLKSHDLVIASATVLKIYASGTLSKAFTVEANQFTLDAIKAIGGADGDTVMVL